MPIWLIITTKKHIVDKNRLKPAKIAVPHSLNTSSALRICLITADPQRAVKNVVADPAFPSFLSSRITGIIGFSKLKARYQTFESRRQLLADHDIFFADDRIITRLVNTLGKTFYKTSKRPIPVRIEEVQKVNGKRIKKEDRKRPATDEKYSAVASPAIVAKELERSLNSVPLNLSPAATTAVRVGTSGFSPQQLAENIDAVVKGLTEKFISKGWRNVKAIHIKGSNTMAMPIWLANELWVDNGDVHETESAENDQAASKKRKPIERETAQKPKKSKKSSPKSDEDADLIAARKEKLQSQKDAALIDGDNAPIKKALAPAEKKKKGVKA